MYTCILLYDAPDVNCSLAQNVRFRHILLFFFAFLLNFAFSAAEAPMAEAEKTRRFRPILYTILTIVDSPVLFLRPVRKTAGSLFSQ